MQDSVVQQLDTLVSQLLTQYSWFIGLAQAIGGLGALCYVFTRVWGHLARNEEIDIVPLFRPVALAICLMSYGGIVNGVTSVSGALNEMTQPFIDSQKTLVDNLTKQKKTAVAAKRQKTLGLIDTDHDGEESWMEILKAMFDADSATQFGADMMSYSVQNVVDQLMTTLGEVLYLFAFLCLKFLVSFFIVVLLITGPITFGLATFEWFYSGLAAWCTRVINMLMWIPITNILSGMLESIHVMMLRKDLQQLAASTDSTFTLDDFTMVIFYLIGTVAYLTVPMAASWVVESSGADQAISKTLGGAKAGGGVLGGVGGVGGGVARSAGRSVSGGFERIREWNSKLPTLNKI
ncbi:hypothetical protein [Spirosoma sp.]|uniref:hypothetical protein n=1 Tax=Spirosoma sp. TaxID=1899569 RepID=UPI00260E6D6E|nr:hypothetical protein [Spirosoma sp.]MCX6213762.1 hypothetical protein [Spirosoma sp.]